MLFDLNSKANVDISEDIRGPKITTAVSATSTAAVILPVNNNRAGYSVYNAGSVPVFIRDGTTITSSVYEFILNPGFLWKENFDNSPRYLGAISAVTASGTSSLLVSEAVII